MQLLDNNLYLKIKYGSSDNKIIVCIKNGISLSLAKILVHRYSLYMKIDLYNDTIHFRSNIIEEMNRNEENKIMIQELKYYL